MRFPDPRGAKGREDVGGPQQSLVGLWLRYLARPLRRKTLVDFRFLFVYRAERLPTRPRERLRARVTS